MNIEILKPVKQKWMKKGEQKRRGYVCAPSDGHTCDLFPTPALSGQVQRVYSQPLHQLVKKHPQISEDKGSYFLVYHPNEIVKSLILCFVSFSNLE